jgi:hypothetical protein
MLRHARSAWHLAANTALRGHAQPGLRHFPLRRMLSNLVLLLPSEEARSAAASKLVRVQRGQCWRCQVAVKLLPAEPIPLAVASTWVSLAGLT